jgi:hypothetical protein
MYTEQPEVKKFPLFTSHSTTQNVQFIFVSQPTFATQFFNK